MDKRSFHKKFEKTLFFLFVMMYVFLFCFFSRFQRLTSFEIFKGRFVFIFSVIGHILVTLKANTHIATENECRVDHDAQSIRKHGDRGKIRGGKCYAKP